MVGIQKFRNGHGIGAITQHADFHGGDLHVFGEGIQLGTERVGRRDVSGLDSLSGLHREGGNRSNSIAIMRGDGFQVRTDASTTTGIEAGNGEDDGEWRAALIVQMQQVPLQQLKMAGCTEKAMPAGKGDCTQVFRRNATIFSSLQ
jgi:hypothetical protein